MNNKVVKTLLHRTNLNIPFSKLLKSIEKDYQVVRKIKEYQPILEGYEDANFKLITTKGDFVLKIFLKDRSKANIDSYVRVLKEAKRIEFPAVKLLKGKTNNLSKVQQKTPTYFIVYKFFQGEDFEKQTPTLKDCIEIAHQLANLNTLTFQVTECYDSWGNKNLFREYQKNKKKLSDETKNILKPVVNKFKLLDFTQFTKAVIHGDLQRKHVLKNKSGEYCILDFGCMSNDARVIELSTFLAWFCILPDTWKDRNKIISKVISEYLKVNPLSDHEIESLPVLTEAAYASYFMKTSILIQEGDKNHETKEWFNLAKEMLTRFRNIKWPN